MEKIVRVNWGRGQFSDVCRSDIVDPSPIRKGQKVRVRWGRNNKEYPATVELCPLPQDLQELSEISGHHVHCTVSPAKTEPVTKTFIFCRCPCTVIPLFLNLKRSLDRSKNLVYLFSYLFIYLFIYLCVLLKHFQGLIQLQHKNTNLHCTCTLKEVMTEVVSIKNKMLFSDSWNIWLSQFQV